MSRALVVVVLLAAAVASAGCLGAKSPAAGRPIEDVKPQTTPSTPTAPVVPTRPPPEERWHFHNYWGSTPNITLLDGPVSIPLTPPKRDATGVRAGEVFVGLEHGKIVPPETGAILVTINWSAGGSLPARLNLSYRPANAENFTSVGPVKPGNTTSIFVWDAMTDIPHRGRSVWTFHLTGEPDRAGGLAIANGTVRMKVEAWIGRPIFIDPPHLDHWNGSKTLPVVDRSLEVSGAKVGDRGYAVAGESGLQKHLAEFRVVDGDVVPAGTKYVYARLSWSGASPASAKPLALSYAEDNANTSGAPKPFASGDDWRAYRIEVIPRMTDSPYTNQSTWAFRVAIDLPAGAFEGVVKLQAWATRVESDEPPEGVLPKAEARRLRAG
ncbi:MAG TPA: hypothetical protein VM889_04865 [Candidatus Thermoplasmatota archaeon]|nr:hypothetical protein [Candidatus Thermoplasmatota archaeon]